MNPAPSGSRACLHNLATKGLPKLHEAGLEVSSAGRILWPMVQAVSKKWMLSFISVIFSEKPDHLLIWKEQKKVSETPFIF